MIDIDFDVRSDIKAGSDPDKYSLRLKQFHKQLWSKNLPSGHPFDLTDTEPNIYLYHQSDLGEFSLSSDSICHSLFHLKRMESIIKQVDEAKMQAILRLYNTVPGFILFPSNRIDNKITINGARGFNARICDRSDLTLECIRRYYVSINSPLHEVFSRYAGFFNLFEDFHGYCDFFLLQDLINPRTNQIFFYLPFDGSFPTQPLPKTLSDYLTFADNQSAFLQARAERMKR